MLVRKSLTLKGIYQFAGHHVFWLTGWIGGVTVVYNLTHWSWLGIPWLPVSVVGTAVAFYVGFKNNQAYDRLWEGRKIWGAILNGSRMWASMVRAYVDNSSFSETQLHDIKRKLIFRHIGWVYTFREQLLVPTQWEHVSLGWRFGTFNQRRRKRYGVGAYQKELDEVNIKKYIPVSEYNFNSGFANQATHIMDKQAMVLAALHREGSLDAFKQIELQKILNDFYDNQGKAERIKKFPLPRQYGSLSFIFVCVFIFLLPFALVGEFSKLGNTGSWLAIPFGVLIGWVYVVMELIGDYSENPFEGLFNDVPLFSICRTIEIDLLQMLNEKDIPMPVQPKDGILM